MATSNTSSGDNRRNTRANSGVAVNSTYMRAPSVSPSNSPENAEASPIDSLNGVPIENVTLHDLAQQVAIQQRTIQMLENALQDRDKGLDRISQRLDILEKESAETKTILHMKDIVIDRLRLEVTKLQQFTRRYCVSISGIPKRDKKESLNDLKHEVDKVINDVNAGIAPNNDGSPRVTMDDIDKFHRDGPFKDGSQNVIIRFKSHSDKETLYRGRKAMKNKEVKIRPSLTDHNRKLLNSAKDYLESLYSDCDNLPNPPHFVMANIHGQIQLKMTNEHEGRLFFTINSMQDLASTITKLNFLDESDDRFYITDSEDESEC